MTNIYSLPYGSRWRHQYSRVIRWCERFKEIHDGERFGEDIDFYYDEALVFFIFCHQLKDWIKKDSSIPNDRVEDLINDNECLQLCADIANGTKHLGIDGRFKPRSGQDSSMRPFVYIDESKLSTDDTHPLIGLRFCLTLEDGRVLEAFDIATLCLEKWTEFLQKSGLLK